jgi:hypothetical protein
VGLLVQGKKQARKKKGSGSGRPLTAAGQRVTGLPTEALRAISGTRQDWQSHAWGYRDAIGELRSGVQFLARAVSQVQFMPAQVNPNGDDPIPFDSDECTVSAELQAAAAEELARLPLGAGYSFLGILVENLSIPGEVWLHGYYDEGDNECWRVRSTDEVEVTPDGRLTIKEGGGLRREVKIRVEGLAGGDDDDEPEEDLLRLWVPHPRYQHLADSPMRALLDVCEEIVLSGMELRAASRSRVMANGILLVPEGLTLLNALVQDRSLANDNGFMAELQATLLAPIGNEGEAGAVVPAVIQGNAEDLEKIRHLKLERTTSDELLDRLERCLKRLGSGMDIPPEIVSGMADVNHWTAWQIDAATFRHHIDPMTRIVGDAFTEGFLRPALLDRGFSRQEVWQIQVWRDAGNLTENPNRGEDAKAAFDRGALGFKSLLEALGFSEADLPTPEEFAQIIAMKGGVNPDQNALILAAILGERIVPPVEHPQVVDAAPERRALPPGESRPAGGSPGNAPARTTPEQAAARRRGFALAEALVAAVTPDPTAGWTVDEDAGRILLELDRALRDRLLVAADALMDRALERAGSRVRSAVQRNAATRAQFAATAPDDITRYAAHVGRNQCFVMGLDAQALLADAFDSLQGKFERWTTSTIKAVAAALLKALGLKGPDAERLQERIVIRMTARMPTAWERLRTGLFGVAERYLFTPDPEEPVGEHSDTIVPPSLIRAALAEVGGMPATSSGLDDRGLPVDKEEALGGISNGTAVLDALAEQDALVLGYEWQYGMTPLSRQFHPHRQLDGYRFADWDDARLVPESRYAWVGPHFTPGDHDGCQCDYRLVFAVPASVQDVPDLAAVADVDTDLGEETQAMKDIRGLAEGDDAAGRRGTTAQRERDTRDLLLALQKRHLTNGGTN